MDEDILGAKVTQIGTKGSNTSDSSVLCGSKHEVWVYTVDYDDNGVVTPGVDNIIVAFSHHHLCNAIPSYLVKLRLTICFGIVGQVLIFHDK